MTIRDPLPGQVMAYGAPSAPEDPPITPLQPWVTPQVTPIHFPTPDLQIAMLRAEMQRAVETMLAAIRELEAKVDALSKKGE